MVGPERANHVSIAADGFSSGGEIGNLSFIVVFGVRCACRRRWPAIDPV
jgi:hypothetical protein